MEISKETYYAVKGLYHLAIETKRQTELYETELNKLIDEENGSHASDAIYCEESIDAALIKMNIVVIEI